MKRQILAAALGMLVSAAVYAAPIQSDNIRPVPVNPAPGSEVSLMDVIQSTYSTTTFAADYITSGQKTNTQFAHASPGAPTTVPTIVIEQTSGASSQTFGIWFGNDTTSILTHQIFAGSDSAGPATGSKLLYIGNGELWINSTLVLSDSRISPLQFGFYFQSGGTTASSADQLSSAGAPRFLSYNPSGNDWIFAFEDGSDWDYQDMVVKVESITNVPLPGTVALLGLGLLGAGIARRKIAA